MWRQNAHERRYMSLPLRRKCNSRWVENWKEAQIAFFESFRNYDEAGSLQRIQVLKYLVLTTMLMGSDINPFDSQETKPYRNDPRIAAMTKLVDAYQREDIHQYESILQSNKDILDDPFIAENIDEVTRAVRTKGVLKLIAPYTRFTLAFIAKQLKISLTEAQDIVGFLIVDRQLKGAIDQEKGTVEVESTVDAGRTQALQAWTSALASLCNTMFREGEGFKADESQSLGGTATSRPDGIFARGGGIPNESAKLRVGGNRGFDVPTNKR